MPTFVFQTQLGHLYLAFDRHDAAVVRSIARRAGHDLVGLNVLARQDIGTADHRCVVDRKIDQRLHLRIGSQVIGIDEHGAVRPCLAHRSHVTLELRQERRG